MAGVRPFGRLADGAEVQEATLAGPGLRARVLTFGAIIRMLEVETAAGWRNVVLGFADLEPYTTVSPYLGAIAGRHANRIRDGRFALDGRMVELTRNEAGRTHLHGGFRGYSKRLWTLAEASDAAVVMTLVDPDGTEGYPGRVEARCRYAVDGEGSLSIELEATADAPTIVNLAAHSYFDLDGGATILDHILEIPAARYTPVDEALIPTGELAPVAGTRFDFRSPRPIGGDGAVFDHNFVLDKGRTDEPQPAARLHGPRSGLTLDVLSTEPGLQFYDGAYLDLDFADTGGVKRRRNMGLCLEPQFFPDAPNRPEWPGSVLRPGETYRQRTLYRFGAG